MHFEKDRLYHIYNQGNNRQKIFFYRENYLFFLRKVRVQLLPYCDILAYCLMPNHFHFMVKVNEVELEGVPGAIGGATPSRTANGTFQKSIGILLASYTRAINKQQGSTGSLFRQKTKAECLDCVNGITPSFFNTNSGTRINIERPEKIYQQVCFNYIHHNPVRAGLTKRPEGWEFSSAKEYAGIRNGTLVNMELAGQYVKPEQYSFKYYPL